MKISASKSAGFIEKPDTGLSVYLLYGPDQGLVKERGGQLAKFFVPDVHDPFTVSHLTGDVIKDDESRLLDEMASVPMLGGRRLVRLTSASDHVASAVTQLLKNPPQDAVCLIEADELSKNSRLRGLCENANAAIAIPCYGDEGAALDKTIASLIKEQGFTLERDAREALVANAPPDRLALRAEIEKLITYALKNPDKNITQGDVMASASNLASEDVDEALWAAFSGDMLTLDTYMARIASDGSSTMQILRGGQRHLLRLYEALACINSENLSGKEALARLRPPVFFKREAAMLNQLRRWSMPKIEKALEGLLEAEIRSKKTGMPTDLIGARALQAVARLGR